MSWLWNMGLWESIVICVGFSVIVIAIDEWIHARRRRRRQGQGSTAH
jgi:hypothetical protein